MKNIRNMEKPSFTLIILLATIRFTSSSSVTFEQHGCESLFTTTIKNLSELVTFSNIPLNLSFKKQVSDFPVVYSLPVDMINNVTEIKWEASYQSTIQNFTAPVPATCCVGSTTPRSINCIDVNITCPSNQCSSAKPWNVYEDFYKMNCKDCACTYCYKGGLALHQLFEVSFKQQDFVMTEQFPRLSKAAAVSIARPTSTPGLQIPALPSAIVLDNPNNETWLRIIEHQGITILQKTVPTDLPEMTFTIYMKNIQQKIIQRYDFYFYPPIQCDIVPKNVTSAIINETVILFFNCSSNSSRTLVYNVPGDHFELRDGKLYVIKEVNGIHEIHLSVQYERISLSKRTWSFNFTTSTFDSQSTIIVTHDPLSTNPVTTDPTVTVNDSQTTLITTLGPKTTTPVPTGPRVTRIAAELLTSNSVSLTCYTNYDFPNITYLWYISNKPVTGMKTEQILASNRSRETITVLNLNQYIPKQTQLSVICRIQHNKLTFNGKQQFDLKSFPDVQLKAPKRSPSYSVVKYSCNANISKAFVRIRLYSFATGFHIAASGSSYTGNFTIVNDTKISCFGAYGDYTGIVKEQTVYIFNANASSLNGVGITMHSFNNITFTCFSESTFAETAYHWYLNGTKTIAGILKEMPGNQTFGYLTLTNLSKDAYVTVTCRWHYRHSFVDQRSISASLWTIPQVTLSSPGASSLYSVVKYSCISTVKNADVHVAVVPLSYKNVSYSVNKGNYEGHFIIWNDTKIFCFANYNGQRGIIQERVVLVRPVNASLLDGVGVIMHSFSNITFSCFTNRTSLNNTYKWYLNGNPITTGISERTLGNKVYGYLTSTNLNQNATVKITCKLFYSNTIVAERSINISIPSIPQVRLTSLNTSSLYSEVNYSCDSNRPNADVYVAVVPLHLKDISYSVQKASYTGRFTISNDTKIFCFATYNDQRGIIQEHVIYALPVNASLLDGVGVIMHSFSNITFSCFSNRTSLNNTYEWYLNGNLITTGISKRTLGNKIYGYLTLTNINQTARVNITCKLFYSNTIVAERSINISIPSIPQVRLTSLNTSSLYSEVNYSCDSNLANADVYVAVVPLHLKDISYSVQKARYTGRFTISNDTKIFCFANYNGQRGIIQEHVIHALPVNASLLDGVGVIMHSFSNITFSCFSNRTSLNNTYEWYLNGNLITTGISKRTLGNKIYGYLTLTNINQNARVNITCKLFYSNTIVAERSINISIPSIPQVRLTSLNTSSLYSEVNYSCDSNLASADVYVAVVPLHLNNISYSVQKARYTGRFTIWNDTKIFCFANYDGQRGIIQEHVIHALPVKAPLLDGVGVIMHSFSNITFSCFSNRTSLNNTYKWYLNGNPITTGISNRTLGNKIYGYLTLTNISPNARDKITCRLFYGNIFVNERSINTSIDSFPQVSLNSPNVSSIYSKVNYSCVSSLPNADVYVAVVPFHYKTISYSVQKAKYSGNFTIQQDMKIFCYANHNGVRGIIKQNVVFLREVQKFTIQRITTTMHSDNNRTFTCYANSTAARITYEWYVNGSRLTAGIKQSTVQNESLSELSLTNLSRNYFAIITCRTFYRTLFMDDQNITTDIASIPQVTINSQNLSLSNSVVNYNCYSNVRNADVYATAVPSTHKTVSYPAAVKGNVTGHFTMVNETKIFCYAEYGNKRGIIKSKTVYLLEIARFSILKITTKQSVNSITFTSRTDSNLTNLIHKWYFNNIDITTKMTQMMVNGKSQSEVTLSDLEENNSDTITCEVFYQTLRIDKKKIYTSISSIPQVTVNVFPMSLVGYSVNYSCKSSVKNSNVHVTVEYPGSSKSYTNVSSYMGRFQMVDDTKISCYAEGDGRRGIIKEKMVTLAKVEEFLITQITTTMHSIDNITFACYTNSSSTAITYKWYFNNSIITSGKKQMLLNRQSVGFLTLSNLRPKDKGLVTCEAYFKILRIAKKQIDFSVSTIPRVTLTSVQVANINTPVVYSCTSSVNNADVYVSSPNTKSINPDQSRSSYNGKFTIISDTKISCYSKHNLLQGPVVETTVFASKGEKSCEEETVEKLVWPKTLSKKNAAVSCPEGFEGSVTRQCNKDGQWENFDQSGCAKIAIIDAKAELEKISLGLSTDLATPVKELATATNTTLKKKELVISFEAITEIVEITENLKVIKEPEIINFFEIGSNLLNEDNKDVWNSIDKEDSQQVDKTPQNMMKNIEKFATVTAEKINKTLDIQKGNILVEIKKVSVNETLKLPTPEITTTTPVWIRNSLTSVTISSESLKEVFSKNETVSVATTIFKGVSGLLQGAGKKELNSYVLSLSLAKATPVNLSNPILLNFEHLLQNFSGPQCSFWDYNLKNTTGGGWSREGCSLNSTNSTLTICACTHLTNFAILMNPWIDVETAHAIQLITTIGCWISIVALVFTIIVYITCWKHVSSRDVAKSRSVLLINLCLSLTCVYLIFLFGIDNTSDKGVCTATAILLLYFLLVAFFSMLAEGIDIAVALTVVFTSDFPRLPWLIATSWLAPAIIVGISLGATQLEGFGNDKFCWLDRESGLIWALIGPVIAIIIANIICCVFALRALMSAGSILKHTTKPTTAERIKKGARAMLVLSPLLGFTWTIGLFAVNEDTVVFEYIFAILATLQGFFIFLAYCIFNDQLRKAFTESKLGSQLLSTKQSTLSLGKTITKGSLDDTNKNEVKSTSLSNYQPYESNKQKNIKSNADFIIKRNSDFDLKKK